MSESHMRNELALSYSLVQSNFLLAPNRNILFVLIIFRKITHFCLNPFPSNFQRRYTGNTKSSSIQRWPRGKSEITIKTARREKWARASGRTRCKALSGARESRAGKGYMYYSGCTGGSLTPGDEPSAFLAGPKVEVKAHLSVRAAPRAALWARRPRSRAPR